MSAASIYSAMDPLLDETFLDNTIFPLFSMRRKTTKSSSTSTVTRMEADEMQHDDGLVESGEAQTFECIRYGPNITTFSPSFLFRSGRRALLHAILHELTKLLRPVLPSTSSQIHVTESRG